MTTKKFNKIVNEEINKVKNTLIKKANEYNLEEDRLGFFKRAAAFSQKTPEQVLFGFLLKHLQSISDMIENNNVYSIELWEEKITDSINYLILLLGLLEDK